MFILIIALVILGGAYFGANARPKYRYSIGFFAGALTGFLIGLYQFFPRFYL